MGRPQLVCWIFIISIRIVVAQDSVHSSFFRKPIVKAFVVPAAFFGAAALSSSYKVDVRDWRNEQHPGFHTKADNYLQYAPVAMVYGLSIAGVEGKHDLANQTALLVKIELLTTAVVQSIKASTNVLRPDSSSYNSFPSGHTAQAFASATFLHKEYGHVSVWYSIGGYTVAAAVGAMRVLNNRHWITDVLAGAGIGILSTNIVYLTHQDKWGKKKKHQALILPTYNNGPGLYFSMQLK